jgi:hypothetical protein
MTVGRENNDPVLHDRVSRALSQYYALHSHTQPYTSLGLIAVNRAFVWGKKEPSVQIITGNR